MYIKWRKSGKMVSIQWLLMDWCPGDCRSPTAMVSVICILDESLMRNDFNYLCSLIVRKLIISLNIY